MMFAPTRLILDVRALQDNYRLLKNKTGDGCQTAAVVKANAYGCGVDVVVPALENAGAPFFYVAQFSEALALRQVTRAPVAVLGGLAEASATDYTHHKIIPVLNSPLDIARCPPELPAIWHIDTGMNRLGLPLAEVARLAEQARALPLLLMTHFASSDDHTNHFSAEQVRLFDACVASLPPPFRAIPQSICNSSAIFRNTNWYRQQVRPGVALYGGNPTPELPNPMKPVIRCESKILQMHSVKTGETAGYNQTYRFTEDSVIATVGIGYADGLLRSGSNRMKVYWRGIACPVVGRISMDLTIVDLSPVLKNNSPLPDQDDWLEILGSHQDVDQLANDLGTIGYEVLTSLSRRATRLTT